MPYRLPIDASRVLRVLVSVSVVLCAGSFATQIAKRVFGHSRLYGFVHLLNVDAENNWPSWWSASLLLVCAVLLGLIATAELRQPGMGLVAVLALLYWGFMRALPRGTARLFYLSALVYLSGALGWR